MANIFRVSTICALLVIAACVMLSGCTSTPNTPTVKITSPANGATLPAGDATIKTTVTNFNVVDKQGQANLTGEGHLHFYMDVSPIPSTAGLPAIPTDKNATWAHVSDTSYTFKNVPPGQHTFAVQLANNDHTPVYPIVTDSVTVTVS